MPQALQSPLKWPKEGNARVPYRVFSDPEIYRAERDRVFLGPTWQYLALDNELRNPGDYKTTFLSETPVIVTAVRTARSMRWSTVARIAATLYA